MLEMFFEIPPYMNIFAPELELQALEGFTDWYKQEYGIDFQTEKSENFSTPSKTFTTPKKIDVIQVSAPIETIHASSSHQEIINKIAGILVDMVIEEGNVKIGSNSLKNYG